MTATGKIAAQLRRLKREAESFALCVLLEDGAEDDGRISAQIDILGKPDENPIAELLGGRRAPYGIPRQGELWLCAILGDSLEEVFLLLPLAPYDGADDLPITEAGKTIWAPPRGEDIQVMAREGAFYLEADKLAEIKASQGITLEVGPLKVEMKPSGKISIGNASAEVLQTISDSLRYQIQTLTTLSQTQVLTLIGPQTLTTSAVFTSIQLEIVTAKAIFDATLKG
jgi:hypothetical protein